MDQMENKVQQFQAVIRNETYPVRIAGEVPKHLERVLNDPGFGTGRDPEERKLAYLVRSGDLLHGMILSGREARQFLKRSEGNFPAALIRSGLGKTGILIRDAAVPGANAVLAGLGLERRFRLFPEKAPDGSGPEGPGQEAPAGTIERIRTAVPRELTAREQKERLQRENDRRRARKREEACHLDPEGIVPLEMSRLEREWNDL